MGDNLRVRLEFQKFENKELRNSLLSFKRSETKDVQSLELLIGKRFKLKQKFSLFIDNFILERTEPIDILRDNDLIVIEPKIEYSSTKGKTEPNLKTQSKVKIDSKTKHELKPKPEVQTPLNSKSCLEYISNKTKPSNTSSSSSTNKTRYKPKPKSKQNSKPYHSSDSESDNAANISKNSIQTKFENSNKNILKESPKIKTEIESKIGKSLNKSNEVLNRIELKPEMDSKIEELSEVGTEVLSVRDIPLRKAFQMANTSIKKKPQMSRNTSTNSEPTKPKPKRKRPTREATEPMDRFSPFVILERHSSDVVTTPMSKPVPNDSHSNDKPVVKKQKQSARKSFATPPTSTTPPTNGSHNELTKTKAKNQTQQKKEIDFDNCEPLLSIPRVGDIIAFKMLTLSSDGISYESSAFNMGSVICVNNSTKMVDIFLQNVIQRNQKSVEQTLGIYSLKINWSTVLEPKLVQSANSAQLSSC